MFLGLGFKNSYIIEQRVQVQDPNHNPIFLKVEFVRVIAKNPKKDEKQSIMRSHKMYGKL